jgi:hypothetical protein
MANTILSPTPFQPFGGLGPSIYLGQGWNGSSSFAPPTSSQDGYFQNGDWWIPYPPIPGSTAFYIAQSCSGGVAAWKAVALGA